jgi:arginine/lysine/ornithine decarboxylase
VGITKGKGGTLPNTLLDFKTDYDRNAPLSEVLPASSPRVASVTLAWASRSRRPDVAAPRTSQQGHWQAQAYATLPKPEMAPRAPSRS